MYNYLYLQNTEVWHPQQDDKYFCIYNLCTNVFTKIYSSIIISWNDRYNYEPIINI